MNLTTSIWRRLRDEDMTEREISEATGIDRGTVHRLLRGRQPTASVLSHLLSSDVLTRSERERLEDATKAPPPPRKKPHDNSRILCISDMHQPWAHRDTLKFLTAVKAKYKPTRVVCLGDEVDAQALKFHTRDPELPSAGDELEQAIAKLKPLYRLFPEVDVIESNHGSLYFRRAKDGGIPRKYLRSYSEVLESAPGWTWHPELLIDIPGGNQAFFHHGLSADVQKVVEKRAVCVVQGHYHTTFAIKFVSNPNNLLWGMQVGCSIDPPALAFEYDRVQVGRPVIGHGLILNGLPHLLPMVLHKGKWNGEVP